MDNYAPDSKQHPIQDTKLKKYYQNVVNYHKFWTYQGVQTRDLSSSERNVLGSVVMILSVMQDHPNYEKNITDNSFNSIFEAHFDIINDILYASIAKLRYLSTFTSEYFVQYRYRLMVFYYYVIRQGDDFSEKTTLTYILGLFDTVTLSHLQPVDKKALIELFLDGEYITGRWNPFLNEYKLTYEESIVKVIRSIAKKDGQNQIVNQGEVDDFMTWLCKKYSTDGQTRFEKLYRGIDDNVVFGDDGRGARGQFIAAVYQLWLVSKYNPHYDGIPEANKYEYTYSPIDEGAGFIKDTLLNRLINWFTEKNRNIPTPLILNYQTEKFLFWYKDNFDFSFQGTAVIAMEKKEVVKQAAGPYGTNTKDVYKRLYGVYHIMQPVVINNYDSESDLMKTIVSMPINTDTSNIDFDDPCAVNQGIDNLLPVFYLQYISDLQDISNTKATLMTTFELVTTVSLIGNFTKLRYLRHLDKIFKLGGHTDTEIKVLKRACEVLFGIMDVTATFSSLAHNLLTDDCHNYNVCQPEQGEAAERCRDIQMFLFALSLFTFGGSIAASMSLRKYAKRLTDRGRSKFPQLSETEFSLLTDIANVEGAVDDFFDMLQTSYPTLRSKLDDMQLSPTQKAWFYEDFVQDNMPLNTLNAMDDAPLGTAMDNWKNLRVLDAVEEAKDLNIITNPTRTNAFESIYQHPGIGGELKNHAISKRIVFVEYFADSPSNIINKFNNDPPLVSSWFRYYDEGVIRLEFIKLSQARQVEFLEDFSDMPQEFFNKLKEKPKAIQRWNNAPTQTRVFARANPELWLYIMDDLPAGTNFSQVPNSNKWELLDPEGIVHFRAPQTGPPPNINFESYIKFKKLSYSQQNTVLKQAYGTFRNGAISSGNAYTNPKTHLGKQIPRSNNGNGVSPDFKNLEMAFDPAPPPYILGNGVTNITGLTEPLQSITQKIRNFGGEVKVPISGDNRAVDFRNAWKALSVNHRDGEKLLKELDLTWHHLDDLDTNMNSTLQLITRDAHELTYSHSGSIKQSDVLFDFINNL